ncbi:MAG TPA: hypothetical protein PLJ23_00260 [Gemmatimonadales bacterium]|nr:hypothetical protein [Gemmatimonadales bacterium]
MSEKRTEYQISDLRAHLPEVFAEVIEHQGRLVRVARRGTADRAVVASEAYVERLEARVKELQHQLSLALGARQRTAPFRLIGSATGGGDLGEALDEIRREQAALAEAKLERLSS